MLCKLFFTKILNLIRPHGQAVKTSPFHGGNSGSIPDGVTISKFMQKLLHLSQIQMWEFCRICKNIEICILIEYISFSLTVYLPSISEEISDNDIDCLLLICILIKLM